MVFKGLPHGVKISISRSIKAAFEKYMEKIEWNEDQFNMLQFINFWKEYAKENSTWNQNLDASLLNDHTFHEELAAKINETIEKVLSEEPTAEQIEELERLIKEQGIKDLTYSCKLEAQYYINSLKNKEK